MPVTEPIPINATPRKPGPARRKVLSERDAGKGLAGNRRPGTAARVLHGRRAAFAGIGPRPTAAGLRVEPNRRRAPF